jgi:hypothetical protein
MDWNSKVLQDRIEKDTLSNGTQKTSSSVFENEREIDSKQHCKEMTPVNILGSNWDVKTDKFQFGIKELVEYTKTLPATKRSVLKASAKIFDPIGIFTVNLKILFQLLCCDRVDRDEKLDENSLAC